MAPMGEYQPIPLDDEKQSDASAWGRRIRHLDDFYHHQAQTAGRLCQHWVWLVHVALLSVSTTLFALAFCLHYGGSSGLVAPPQSSIYCKC
ncbi:hypothetical protein MYCTH_2297243 [Thermothelomyces thermophilus ATCC 42464]|uniref:Uncharacterized protein n=1 Tax=Thermothelomyces thermophilus (strain ATCC 42464 / BCRC 31852 / DSM 1799) TaxID=573729 RepID=G2Q519_THET4|nr:uncharacterized protein MYCTH_2297243 [Thermothelomyces thermophilus ATCC 42464]AEO54557.1 hypothetical protein MYCTH_2297243 [Thermothelomyces thermophilus ATCC 42464]